MKTVQITEAAAIQAHKAANQEGKNLLENLIGKQLFNQKITDRVKTFEDACAITGDDPGEARFTAYEPDVNAYNKLRVIVKALNEGWTPDWNNSNERKWRPWFYLDNPGFRFDDSRYGNSTSTVGSRLCLKSEELCNYAAKQFLPLYKDLFN